MGEALLRRRRKDRRGLSNNQVITMKEHRMNAIPAHKFKIGSMVRLNRSPNMGGVIAEAYEILAQLPESEGVLQYRIKSSREPHQRLVKESELEFRSAQAPQGPDVLFEKNPSTRL
jgi:hypothetical protein